MRRERKQTEATAITTTSPTESLERPESPVRHEEMSPNFASMYANDVQVTITPWDMRFIFGQIQDIKNVKPVVVSITQVGELRVSLQLAKKLTMIMLEQIRGYEQRVGEICMPPG